MTAGMRSDASVLKCLEHKGFGVNGDTVAQAPSEATAQQILTYLDGCGVKVKQVNEGFAKDVMNVVVERELRRSVECIRKRGFDVTVGHDLARQPYDAAGIDTSLPAFRNAVRACRQKFTEAIRVLEPEAVPEGRQGTASGPQQAGNGRLARCLRRFGGTVVYAHGGVGVRVPSDIPLPRLQAMLHTCEVNPAVVTR
jgi:hypothetical protein